MPEDPLLRFLLDNDFPKPEWNVHQLDETVEYVHVFDFDAALVEQSTPDWMLQLIADDAGFTGLVTGDYHSIAQDEEVVALEKTTLSIVTWKKGIDNPIVQWGSLLAYMPRIKDLIAREGPHVITLPVPTLFSNHERTRGIARRYATEQGTTIHELRKQVLPDMVDELRQRDRADLIDRLDPPKRLLE